MKYWLDTEFIERGPEYPIQFLSIGMIAEDGREFYCEAPDARQRVNADHVKFNDRWLIDNVRPYLSDTGEFSSHDVRSEVLAFCDAGKYGVPEFWGYFADYDWVVFCQLFGRMIDLPKGWPMYCLDLKQSIKLQGIARKDLPTQEGPEHNALNDARWIQRAWKWMYLP